MSADRQPIRQPHLVLGYTWVEPDSINDYTDPRERQIFAKGLCEGVQRAHRIRAQRLLPRIATKLAEQFFQLSDRLT
jgi:hypothetical protein